MYEVISDIINHDWVTQGAGEQQYIYYICGAVIVVFFAIALDFLYRIISAAIGRRR